MGVEKSTFCCPECRREMTFEEIVNNEVQAELYALLNKQSVLLKGALMSYVGLFRGVNKIPFAKSLKIVTEVLAMDSDQTRLAVALSNSVDGLRVNPSKLPLTHHNYLRKVLSSTPATVMQLNGSTGSAMTANPPRPTPNSKVAKGVGNILED